MKVILLRDVAKIGRRFEIKDVPDGYAQNKLIPQKDAEAATPANIKRVLAKNKSAVTLAKNEEETALLVASETATDALLIVMEANDQGHLFQSVHTKDIVLSASRRGLVIPESSLIIETPIKSLGRHEVDLVVSNKKFKVVIQVEAKSK